MAYVTQQDLIDRFGEKELLALADRDCDEAVDADVVASAIADAESEINSYLGKRYALPLSSVPPVLTRMAADLARLFLYADLPPDYVAASAKNVRAWLRDVADGKVEMGVAPPPAASADGAKVEGPGRVFSSTTMKGF